MGGLAAFEKNVKHRAAYVAGFVSECFVSVFVAYGYFRALRASVAASGHFMCPFFF